MASTVAVLAATLALFSSALAFSPDQCNATTYGKPDKAACNTLLKNIAALGVGNTSYLFIPSEFPTPAGLSNGTRKNFPQSWTTTGCNAALVPIQVSESSVTYDTSTYQDLATVGGVIVQQCISNSTGGGGWELAGDEEDLVLHLYASGSQIASTIKAQTNTDIAATSEDEIDDAELDDPVFNGPDGGDDSDFGTGTGTTTGSASGATASHTAAAAGQVSPGPSAAPAGQASPGTSSAPAVQASVVKVSQSFNYIGCQFDSSTSRTLSSLSWSGTGLTVERCATYCAAYQYMGVEFGSQCYCGGDANSKGVKPATIVTTGTTNCTTPCNGDATQLCGGNGWMNAYQNTNGATAGGPTA